MPILCSHAIHLHVQDEMRRQERFRERMAERTIDAQRASATVPRWARFGGGGTDQKPHIAPALYLHTHINQNQD